MRRLFTSILCLTCAATAGATDLPRVFMTSVSGTGNLSSWPDAHAMSGLHAADEICRSRATAAGLANAIDYVAWLSDGADDAYCRLHGLEGKRNAAQPCGQSTLPTNAGPWYRLDDQPAIDIAKNWMVAYPEAGYQPRHILFDEFATELPLQPQSQHLAFTASTEDGASNGASQTCGNWTSTTGDVLLGGAYRGYFGLSSFGWQCDKSLRLICMQRGQHGPALSRFRPGTARLAFTTSGGGTGNLASWTDAGGAQQVQAGDKICQAHASRAGLHLAATYKAWLSTSLSHARNRFQFDGPWHRIDGVRFATSKADLTDGSTDAPLQVDELGRPMPFESVWTGTNFNGNRTPFTCDDWTSTDANGTMGQNFAADGYWTVFLPDIAPGCNRSDFRLYCLADNDSLFIAGFD